VPYAESLAASQPSDAPLMRAAVLQEYGVPSTGEFEEPAPAPAPGQASEQAVVEVLAAGLNPVALGISGLAAWLALTWRAALQPGEHVLVLAASGVLGQIAVQAAKLLGAGRVVAAARSAEGLARCRELGADASVRLAEPGDLSAAMAQAGEGRIDVVLDPLWGVPLVAALGAASFGARIVQIGAGAGVEAMIPSAAIRGKMLVLMGHTNFAAPPEVKREAYTRMAEAAARGELEVEIDALGLDQVGEAWRRLAAGSHRKIVLVP
jgi:NADPH:quinone reductase-like Zn-dependent oxidoreductase